MTVTVDYSLRIGTFNTQLDSWIFEVRKVDFLNPLDVSWFVANLPKLISGLSASRTATAAQIADRVLTGGFDYDIVAFNEVFHEDARAVLVSALAATFPFYVEKSPVADSHLPGLVLDLLPTPVRNALELVTPGAVLDAEDSGLMIFSRFPIEKSAFVLFEAGITAIPDSLASKGALYVRVLNPRTGR